jgi:hypothetical protein
MTFTRITFDFVTPVSFKRTGQKEAKIQFHSCLPMNENMLAHQPEEKIGGISFGRKQFDRLICRSVVWSTRLNFPSSESINEIVPKN